MLLLTSWFDALQLDHDRASSHPHEQYLDGDRVDVKVNKLTSTVTQLPYDYYRLAFCQPKELINSVENLGEVLHGSMIQNSAYELYAQNSDFKVLCKVDMTEKEAKLFGQRIKEVCDPCASSLRTMSDRRRPAHSEP